MAGVRSFFGILDPEIRSQEKPQLVAVGIACVPHSAEVLSFRSPGGQRGSVLLACKPESGMQLQKFCYICPLGKASTLKF